MIKVCVINIGNELLLGQTVNTNLSWLGKELAQIGLPITRAEIIRDEAIDIIDSLSRNWQSHDIVILSGGLGPTDDDITKASIAEFFQKPLEFDPDIWKSVQAIFTGRGIEIPQINRSQAFVPQGFTAFINNNGTAPGLYYRVQNKAFIALPGVPQEFKGLYQDYLKSEFIALYNSKPIQIKNIHTWKISESALAEKLADINISPDISLAWLPQTGRVDLRIYGSNSNTDQVINLANKITEIVPEYIWGIDDDTPASVLAKLLIKNRKTVAAAESCTGGWVEKLITDIPGASQYFTGGAVTYSDLLKMSLLNIEKDTLNIFGAVSEETAGEMSSRIREVCSTDLGISVTGIAGPNGGSASKPVGLVCFGISDSSRTLTSRIIFNGNRDNIRWKAAEYIMLLLIEYIRSRT